MGNKQQLQLNNETLDSILSNVLGLPAQVDPLSDTDLIPENIREGIDIWGVVGTLVEGVAGIDFGEITLASTAESVTVVHNLGVVPSCVALIPKNFVSENSRCLNNVNGVVVRKGSASSLSVAQVSNSLTTTEITFVNATYAYKATDYYWIAVA